MKGEEQKRDWSRRDQSRFCSSPFINSLPTCKFRVASRNFFDILEERFSEATGFFASLKIQGSEWANRALQEPLVSSKKGAQKLLDPPRFAIPA